MQIEILARGTETLVRQCPGPLLRGGCPISAPSSGRVPCAGHDLLARLRVVGPAAAWRFSVADDAEQCPVYLLGGRGSLRGS